MFLEPTEQLPVNETAAAAMATPGLFRQQVRLAGVQASVLLRRVSVHPLFLTRD